MFARKYALHAYMPLDLDLMNEAAALVVGTHDFSAFMSTASWVMGMSWDLEEMVFASRLSS